MKVTIRSNIIGYFRQLRNLTQQQLADELGWSLRKLSSYERGERIPPLTEEYALAQALGGEITDIWRFKEE